MKFRNQIKKLFPNTHALIVTVIIFLFIGGIKLVTFQLHFFDPFNNGIKDYEVTDIIFSRLRDTTRVKRSDGVVLIHVSNLERRKLARMLERIHAQSPKAIGLDLFFAERRDPEGDSLLSRRLQEIPNIVLAGELTEYVELADGIAKMKLSDPLFSRHAESGYSNFLARSDRTVRHFSPKIATLDGKTHRAFAVALAKKYDPEVTKRLWRRNKHAERINYIGDYRSFHRLTVTQVLEGPEEGLAVCRDRIVMIGYVRPDGDVEPLEDRYYTPLNPVYTGRSTPDMYGMVIHANIVAMILSGKYIYELPKWIVTILVWLFAYWNVLIIYRIYVGLPDIFHGVTRILQILEFTVFFFILALLFHYFRVRIDFSRGFLALLLAYDILMIYESFLKKKIPALDKL